MNLRGNRLLRFMDRYLGIPLIVALGILRKKNAFSTVKTPHIALLKTAGIGDTVLLSAIIQDIKYTYPQADITLFAGDSNSEMGKLIPGIEVVSLSFTNPLAALREIRKKSFDFWLDFGPWPRINALYTYLARASYKIGFKTPRQYRHYIYDQAILHRTDIHELDNFRNLAHILGVKGKHLPKIPVASIEKIPQRIAIHMFPSGTNAHLRKWSREKWVELIDQLALLEYECILTGSSSDKKEADIVHALCKAKEKIHNVAGKLSLKETALLLAECGKVISVDTGIMHLSAALGKHLVSLHGPTPPSRWGGIGEKVISLTCCETYPICNHVKQGNAILQIKAAQILKNL